MPLFVQAFTLVGEGVGAKEWWCGSFQRFFCLAGRASPEIRLAVVPKSVETHGNKLTLNQARFLSFQGILLDGGVVTVLESRVLVSIKEEKVEV